MGKFKFKVGDMVCLDMDEAYACNLKVYPTVNLFEVKGLDEASNCVIVDRYIAYDAYNQLTKYIHIDYLVLRGINPKLREFYDQNY